MLLPSLVLLPTYEPQLAPMHACMHSNQCHIYMWAPSIYLHSLSFLNLLCCLLTPYQFLLHSLNLVLSFSHLQVVTTQPISAAHPPPPPTTWIAWSIFSCLCCAWPCGLVAIMYSMKVNCCVDCSENLGFMIFLLLLCHLYLFS